MDEERVEIKLSDGRSVFFTPKNISSLAGSSRQSAIFVAEILRARANHIKEIIETTGLAPSGISSMFAGCGERLDERLDLLREEQNRIKFLVKEEGGIFTVGNLSHLLSASNSHLSANLMALVEYEGRLRGIVEKGAFTAGNISNMIGGTCRSLSKTIASFLELEPRLSALVAREVFSADSLSNILRYGGQHLATRLQVVEDRWDQLSALAEQLGPTGVASRLSSTTTKDLEKRIDNLYRTCCPEIENGGEAPSPVGAKVVAFNRLSDERRRGVE